MLMLLCSRSWRTCEGGAGGQINAAESGGIVEESLLQQKFRQQFWTWTHSYKGLTEIQQCLCPGVAVVRDCGGTCYLLTPGLCACKFTELGQSYKEEWGEIEVCPHEKTIKCQKELQRYDYIWNHLFVLKPICSFYFDTIYCFFFFFLLSVSKIPVTPTESMIYCCKAAQETSAGWADCTNYEN